MNKTVKSILIAAAVLLGAFGLSMAIPESESKTTRNGKELAAVPVEVFKPQLSTVQNHLKLSGKLKARDRFEIYAQVEGALLYSANKFREGTTYRKGQTLLAIDQNEFRNNLLSQKSDYITRITGILPDLKADFPGSYPTWKNYVSTVDIRSSLPALPESTNEQEKFFLTGKGIYSAFFAIKSGEEKLGKYTISAPYDGIVTKSAVDAGMAVRPGSNLGTYVSTDHYELEVTIPAEKIQEINKGMKAVLHSSDMEGSWEAEIVRISGAMDERSQSVKVFLSTEGEALKEGMFLVCNIALKPFENAMSVPRKLLDHQNRIFVVQDGQLQQQKVEVLSTNGEVAVISGLGQGATLLKTVVKSAYHGMPVSIL